MQRYIEETHKVMTSVVERDGVAIVLRGQSLGVLLTYCEKGR